MVSAHIAKSLVTAFLPLTTSTISANHETAATNPVPPLNFDVQCPNSPPTRGSRWMTAGLIQDADLDTGTVARVDTKPLLSCQPRVRALHL